jgi:hypothetical protein
MDAIGTVGMASEESVRGLLKGASKIRDIVRLRRLTAQIRAAAEADAAAAQAAKSAAHLQELEKLVAADELGDIEIEIGAIQEAAPEPNPKKPPVVLSPQAEELLKFAGPVQTEPLGKGGLNDVAKLVSPDPAHPTYFKKSPCIDPELCGMQVDGYAVKRGRVPEGVVSEAGRDLSERDKAVYLKTSGVLSAQKEKYEGIRLAETHWMGKDEKGLPLVVQKLAKGQDLYTVLEPDMAKIFGRAPSEKESKNFFALLLRKTWSFPETPPKPVALEKVLPDLLKTFKLSDAPENVARVEAILSSPDNARIRTLMERLRELGSDPAIVASHEKAWALVNSRDGIQDAMFAARMPWMPTGQLNWLEDYSEKWMSLDTNPGNFFLERGADGRYAINLFDW